MQELAIFVDLSLPVEEMEMLQESTRGHRLVFPLKPVSSVLAKAEPDPRFASVDIAFGQPDTVAIAEAPALKWLHVSSSGITRYDNPEFRQMMAERKIIVSNSASVYDQPCAVHVMSFMLAQARKLPRGLATRTANGTPEWHDLRASSNPLFGETVLIVGYGAIGKVLTQLLGPFRMNLLAYRRRPRGDEGIPVVTPDKLDAVLSTADHVINILPDSLETRHFFDVARFSRAKPGSVFYNIGRGTTVDQQALVAALRSKHFQAAWLDVTDPEPLPDDHPLWKEPNCHITPHIAGGHTNETTSLVRHFVTNFDRFLRGEPLLDRVM